MGATKFSDLPPSLFLASVFEPFLKRGFNLAGLHLLGKVDSFIDKLQISVIGVTRMDEPSLRNLPATLSNPAALVVLMLCKHFKTISSVL